MVEASRQFVLLDELHEKAGARIARLTRAEGAFISAGAASGMFLVGAACLTGEDPETIRRIPDTGNLPNEFIISLVHNLPGGWPLPHPPGLPSVRWNPRQGRDPGIR